MLPLAFNTSYVLADPAGVLLLLCGIVTMLFTLLTGAYLVLGALGELVTANSA